MIRNTSLPITLMVNEMEMKYVVVESEEQGEQLFIFPKNIEHDRFVDGLKAIRIGDDRNWKRIYREPISAGFTDLKRCYGRSETLDLDSRNGADTTLLMNSGVKA